MSVRSHHMRSGRVTRVAALVLAILFSASGRPMAASAASLRAPAAASRVIVLTDIEADPDDTQSLVRLLLYSNELDIQGLVATTSTHKRGSVAPESIRAIIEAYSRVQSNLVLHDPRYPKASELLASVTEGRAAYGMAGVGSGMDSPGSDWIIRKLEAPDDRPLWISVWGGANTLAQALYKLRQTRSAAELARLVAKLRVYSISDQDDAGPWIRHEFPTLFYIVSPGGDYSSATWQGINLAIPGIDNTTISNRWIAEHIQQGHGPLGAAYPDVAWGVEGDTPSWLNLIPNGLNQPEHPEWGGWGGRYELYQPSIAITDPKTFIGGIAIPQETRAIWTNAVDEYFAPLSPEQGRATRAGDRPIKDFKVTLWRWRDDFQNDFAARIDWTSKPPAQANHPPQPRLDHSAEIVVKAGQGFGLSAKATSDPDGDSLSYFWFHYPEAGSHKSRVKIDGAENQTGVWITAPQVSRPETLHFILRVADKGTPALARYQRVIVTVKP